MPGIAGVVGLEALESVGMVERMLRSVRQPGADPAPVARLGAAVLGHHRLAVAGGESPGAARAAGEGSALAAACNGIIYNRRELRVELEGHRARFRADTIPELLLHGYREWGLDGLVLRLRGPFAFALWDAERQTLSLVRDRLGVKPLAFVATPHWIGFGCTPRALRSAGLVEELEETAIAEFLEFGFITDGRSIYRQVAKVPPATIVQWRAGRVSSRRYWMPEAPAPARALSFESAVERTEAQLLRAVERRLEPDAPIGALLSAGIDSTLVCWSLRELDTDFTALTLGVPGDPADEAASAVRIARRLGIPHRAIDLSDLRMPSVEGLIAAYAEPFACASALGMLTLAEAVAPSARILLTGDGGDDVFLGYRQHRYLWIGQQLARFIPGALARGWEGIRPVVPRPAGPIRRALHYLDMLTGGLGAFVQIRDGLPFYQEREMFGERLRDATVEQRAIPRSPSSARRMLAEYLDFDRSTHFTGEYLIKIDGATRRFGIEARSPFLDHELWSFAAALPYSVRLRRGELKAVLREIVRRRVGPEVAAGRKRGFTIPAQRWVAGEWRGRVREAFTDSLLEGGGWMRPGSLRRELDRLPPGSLAPLQLWYLYVLELWLRAERGLSPR